MDSLPLIAEDDDDPLAGLFNTILRFVQVNCSGVMELSDKVSAKARKSRKNVLGGVQIQSPLIPQETGTPGMEGDGRNHQGFEILANVVWAEVANAIMSELGNVVFSAGNPDEFQKVSANKLHKRLSNGIVCRTILALITSLRHWNIWRLPCMPLRV